MFCDYQINLGNTINLISSLEGWGEGDGGGEIFNIFGKEEEPYMGELGIFLGDLITS